MTHASHQPFTYITMGLCCPTFGSQHQANGDPRSPLLGRRGASSSYTGTGPTPPPSAARGLRPGDPSEPHLLCPIAIRPVYVSAVDKQLYDHAHLFNEHLQRADRLRDVIFELKYKFDGAKSYRSIEECFTVVRSLIADDLDKIKVIRNYQYCMEIEYSHRLDQDAIKCFELFNEANKLIKLIIEKGQVVVNSVELVITNERHIKREVLVASLGQEGPQCMKNCIDNVTELKKVASHVDDIRSSTQATFLELRKAAAILTAPEELDERQEAIRVEVNIFNDT
ncbi:hypothetical protein CAPTEDRAFT_227107 [Capitella teleta]|uniref:Uncharacterized protein n=1 Tax=Capitella teleta TaxID=283909 RepID=R7U237_CAPTE|nr:hypothetical protein CAPTEDRAFT_227107 [Capitella teleta]|eukprot:ELT97235.1 hypothetical protein CAPTEDRAFT_227107 [Capitella teleta]